MDYSAHYDALIRKYGSMSKLHDNVELHHIIPRCMSGTDSWDNLRYLDYKAHYVAHRLLSKIYPTDVGLKIAVWRMSEAGDGYWGYRVTSSVYSRLREEARKINSKTATKSVELKRGIFGWSKEKIAENCKNAARISIEKVPLEVRQAHGRKMGLLAKEKQLGVFAMPKHVKQEIGRKVAKILNSTMYRCEACGMVANVGNIGYHQKISGHSGKTKL